MFVEEGFRIRFANGEVIDFYADSAAEKEKWMVVLDQCVGKESRGIGWCDAVLKWEAERQKGKPAASKKDPRQTGHARTRSMIV